MSVGGVVEDLIALQRLAEQERDAYDAGRLTPSVGTLLSGTVAQR